MAISGLAGVLEPDCGPEPVPDGRPRPPDPAGRPAAVLSLLAWAADAGLDAGEVSGTLLRLAGQGDQAAWSRLVERHSGMLWRVARGHRLPEEDAADVVQVTWLRLAERIGQVREPERVAAWLAATARRECLAVLRRDRRTRPLDGVEVPTPATEDPATLAAAADERRLLLLALHRLPPRQCLLLRALALTPPPSYQEVAVALGMPLGSIGPTRKRALARLRRELLDLGVVADRRLRRGERRRAAPAGSPIAGAGHLVD